jgi:hypothetical protein
LITEILSVYLGLSERYRLSKDEFRFRALLPEGSQFIESAAQRFTPTSPITFQTRYFSLSLLPQTSIDTDVIGFQKLISLITSTLRPVGKVQFFEHDSSIMLTDDPLRYRQSRLSALRVELFD